METSTSMTLETARSIAREVLDRGWFGYFRFYAPTEPDCDRNWSLPDIEKRI